MRLSKREQILIIGALIIAIMVLFINYYYFPIQAEIKNLKTTAQEVTLKVENAKQKKALTEQLTAELTKLQETSDENKEYVIDSFDDAEILVYINDNLGDYVSKDSIQYTSTEQNDLYVTCDVTIDFKTDYDELKQIILNFEEGDYYTSLTKLEVKSADSTEAAEDEYVEELDEDEIYYPLEASIGLRFYAKSLDWDGQADYNFMDGLYTKDYLFE